MPNANRADWTILTGSIPDEGVDSTVFEIGDYRKGMISVSSLTGTALTFKVCDTRGGTYGLFHNVAGTAYSLDVTSAKTGQWVALPDALLVAKFLIVITGTTQAEAADAPAVVKLMLKT